MKVLLINPPPRTPDRPSFLVPPLGLAYLAAVLEKNKIPVEILDANALRLSWRQFHKIVKQKRPEIIGYTGMTPIIDTTFKAAKISRPFTKHQILGGPHATTTGQAVFQKTADFDFVIVGEAEITFLKLVKALLNKKSLSDLPGLVTKDKVNPRGQLIKDLDSLPFPSRHLLPQHLYRYNLVRDYPFTTMVTSRGCPFQCLFCDKAVFGYSYRKHSAEHVLAEIEEVVKKFHVRTIIFFDDLFTFDKDRIIKICQGIIKRNLKLDWKAEARVDTVDIKMLKMMKKAGCSVLGFGIESANQKSLDFLGKKTTLPQIKKALRMTRKAGIRTLGYFILGIPGETYKESQKTIELSLKLCDFAAFSVLIPYPGTKLYSLALEKGWIRGTDAQNPFDQDLKKPALVSPGWTADDLKKIIREAHTRFYFRPSYIFKQALTFRNPTQIGAVFKHAFRLFKWSLGNVC